jgi:putative oxidoreductase
MADAFYLLARIALPIVFIISGAGAFMNVTGVANMLAAKGFPQPLAFGYAVATLEVVGSALIIAGFKARWAAIALLLFTAGTIAISHNFWDMEGVARAANQTQALKNLSIMAGLLMIASMGAGRYSIDGRDE